MSDDKTPLQQCIESGQVSPEQIEAHRVAGDLGGGDEINLRLPRTPPFPTVRIVGCSVDKTESFVAAVQKQIASLKTYNETELIPYSLSRQMAELQRAERKALDEALAPARQKMQDHFFEMLTLGVTRYNRVNPEAFGLSTDELKAYDNTEDVKMVSSDPDNEFRELMLKSESHHFSYVKTALQRIAQELGITVEQLRAQAGKPIAYKGGTLYLIPRTSHTSPRPNTEPLEIEFFTAPLGAEWDELDRGALAQHAENISGAVIDEVTIPKDQRKMCIQCGRKQEADGTLTCGH